MFRFLKKLIGISDSAESLADEALYEFYKNSSFFYNITRRLESRLGLHESRLKALYREYARYLALKATSPNDFEVPSKIVDEIWHEHLQFNLDYEKFCKKVFGRVIYHVPGAADKSDSKVYDAAYAKTFRRYCEAFGTPPEDVWGKLPQTSKKTTSRVEYRKARSSSDYTGDSSSADTSSYVPFPMIFDSGSSDSCNHGNNHHSGSSHDTSHHSTIDTTTHTPDISSPSLDGGCDTGGSTASCGGSGGCGGCGGS